MNGENDEAVAETGDDEMAGGALKITDLDVEGWKREIAEIDRQVADLMERKSRVQRKLSAISELEDHWEGASPTFVPHQSTDEHSASDMSLIDAIPSVIRKSGKPLTPSEIRDGLPKAGFNRPFASSYFYTAIQRAAERGLIVKTQNKRYMVSLSANGTH